MAQWKCFCNLTNSYFLISPNEYSDNLMEELWGCVKYIGLPWDMVMSLPIQDRKYFIQKHNYETEEANKASAPTKEKRNQYSGEMVNKFVKQFQKNP